MSQTTVLVVIAVVSYFVVSAVVVPIIGWVLKPRREALEAETSEIVQGALEGDLRSFVAEQNGSVSVK